MILYEYEGKHLLSQAGINIPKSQLIDSTDQIVSLKPPLVLKAQVLSGKRAQAGGVVVMKSDDNLKNSIKLLFSKIINREKVEKVLIEEKVEYNGPEIYLSLSYDTDSRGPVFTISQTGGAGVEGASSKSFPVSPLTRSVQNKTIELPQQLIESLINLFFDQDCLLMEINPLVKTDKGWIALDAKVKLDDSALMRHENWRFQSRSTPGHTPTHAEVEAKKIDEGDYRGVAGSTYFDLDGDIGVLSSGGGVSLTAMDALIKASGKPANFTEYSGNPPKEKVIKLTKIVLSKPNLHGLWVIGTVAANFTDIYETLSGIIEGIRQAEAENGHRLTLPIVIRRGGPRDKEAFEMLKEIHDLNLTLQGDETSIAESAKIVAQLSESYVATS